MNALYPPNALDMSAMACTLVSALVEPAAILRGDGTIAASSVSFANAMGRSADTMTDLDLTDFLDQADRSALQRFIRDDARIPSVQLPIGARHSAAITRLPIPGPAAQFLCQLTRDPNSLETRSRFLLEHFDHGFWESDLLTDQFIASDAWHRMRGIDPIHRSDINNRDWILQVHPDDQEALREAFDAQKQGKAETLRAQYRQRHAEGHWIWILCEARVMTYKSDGKPRRIIGTDTDITHLRQSEAARQRLTDKLQLAIEASGMGIWEFDPTTASVHWDDRMLEIYGLTDGRNNRSEDLWETYLHPDDLDDTRAYADRCQRDNLDFRRDYRIVQPGGAVRHVRSMARAVSDSSSLGKLIGVNIDVTEDYQRAAELEEAKQQLEYDARHDALTGLGNRRLLDEATGKLFKKAAKGSPFAVLHLDLDFFKAINDALGHAFGDAVLVSVASRLREIVGDIGIVCRVGGDEFVILLTQSLPLCDIETMCEAIVARCSEPTFHEGHSCVVGISIGIALASGEDKSPSQVFKNADAALYTAKAAGRGKFQLYNPAIKSRSKSEANERQELLDALEGGEIISYYQLQYDAQTLQITGAEALVRWNSPLRGVLTPDQFLPLATKVGLVSRIDEHVFTHVLDQQTKWHEQGVPFPTIALNVTKERLLDDTLINTIDTQLKPHHTIAFELLETAFLDDFDEVLAARLDALRDRGIRIELDDFGSGHSSIVALQAVRPDRVKIDRRLVSSIDVDPSQIAVLQSLTKIARLNNSEVVIEGLETGIHLAAIRNVDCDVLQGFALKYPMPADALQALMQKNQTS